MPALTRRERVRRTLNHQEPDRVPIDLGGRVTNIHYEAYARLAAHLGIPVAGAEVDPFYSVMNIDPRLLERLGVDFQYLYFESPERVRLREHGDGAYDNEWQIRVETRGYHSQRVSHPLEHATVSDLEHFSWPDPYRPGRVDGLAARAQRLFRDTDYALVAPPVSGGIFEFGQHLRGMANFLMDLMNDKPFANCLLDHMVDVQKGLWDVFLKEAGECVEIVQMADDFGTQKSLMISPRLFRELFKPRYTELIRFIKQRTAAKVFFHCDGAILPLIGDFVDMGVDVLNPLQPTAEGMDPGKIKAAHGERLAFHGAIDNQQLLPNGTPAEIRDATRRVIRALAPGGGLILASAHVIEPDIPTDNVVAFFDAAHEYGEYPIQ